MTDFPISYHRDPSSVLKTAIMRAATTRQEPAASAHAPPNPAVVEPPVKPSTIAPPRKLWFFIEDVTPQTIRVATIQRVVAAHYEIAMEDMLSEQRSRLIAFARQVGIYLARKMTTHSTAQIARWFNRDHTTAMHALRKISTLVEKDADLERKIDGIRRKIEERS